MREGQRAGSERHEREVEGRAVGQRLGARARRLRLRDEAHDAGERRLLAGAGHLDRSEPCAVDRAGDDLVALCLSTGAIRR
jgi:hypothetical protein